MSAGNQDTTLTPNEALVAYSAYLYLPVMRAFW